MAHEETVRIYTGKLKEAMPQVAEETLSDACHTGFESANEGLETASVHTVERIPIKMAQNGTSEKEFYCYTERWPDSSTFMDAFARCALTFSRFVRSVAKFTRKNMKE